MIHTLPNYTPEAAIALAHSERNRPHKTINTNTDTDIMSNNNYYEEESLPLSREEFGELVETLEKLMANDVPNIQEALQPTNAAIKELAALQAALKKETIED
jgi:hypothetical protein